MDEIDEIFNNSYERCQRRTDFFDRFYDNYVAANATVAQKFANTDMDKQNRMLRASLHMLMALRSTDAKEAITYFRGVGEVHSHNDRDIRPEMYDLWLVCLLRTVQECDDRYDENVARAWKKVLAGGIQIMKSMY